MRPVTVLLALAAALFGPAVGGLDLDAGLAIEHFRLTNGMSFLLLQRPDMPTVEAGWVVDAGSAADPSDGTGSSHLIEHLLFKGTRTIGARDIDRELELLARLDAIDEELEGLDRSPSRRTQRRRERLVSEQRSLAESASALSRLGALSLEYSRAGAARLNANTTRDSTLYYVTMPAEKLELWFWLEADRLTQPVFRELDKEKRVIAEERRLRIDSAPTGSAERELERAFWRGTPYEHSTLGRPADVEAARRPALESFFREHYRPERITAVLVGSFDPIRVRQLAQLYFGGLEDGSESPAIPTIAVERPTEERLSLLCECPEQVRILYPTVPFGHPDQFALQTLAGVLNGRAGRLYRNLVLGSELAFAAWAQQTPLSRAGVFTVTLEAKGGTGPERLVEAWDRELGRLTATPIDAEELLRVQHRLATERLDQLKDPHVLMRRLLLYAGLGDWRVLSDWTRRTAAVTPEDLQATARAYLNRDGRIVGHFGREPRQ